MKRDGYEPPVRRSHNAAHKPSRNSSCTRKSPYLTEADAEVAVIYAKEQRCVDLWVYQCPYCEMWHLTSVNPDKKRYKR